MSKINANTNLYELLGIDIEAEQSEIRKAYRKKALECHPDKNPDNPKAAELFHQLSSALEILTDPVARTAFDKILKAKKAAELRTRQLDSKRQKFKTDLEQREKDAQHKYAQPYTVPKSDEEILQERIERLRREGSRLLEEEQNLMRKQLQRTMNESQPQEIATQPRLKIKWKADKKDVSNGGYTQKKLNNYLKKYGDIIALIMSKKPGSALVEFKCQEAAEMALAYEKGCLENPLNLSWITPPQTKTDQRTNSTRESVKDFEDLVMRKLRQAEERRKLIEQMQREDAEDERKN